MRKVILVLISLLLFVSFSACTNSSDQDSSGLQGNLLVWHNWPNPESTLITELVERFESAHPGVTVVVEYVSSRDLDQRYMTSVSSGLGPDVIIGPELFLIRDLVDADLLLDLSTKDLHTDNLLSQAVDALWLDDTLYGIPFAAYTSVLYYNKELVETPARTLSELITESQSGQIVALPIDFYHAYWGIRTHGGEVLNEAGQVVVDDGLVAWLNWLNSAQAEPTIILNNVYDDLFESFTSGEVAYFVGNSSDLPDLRAEMGEDVVGVGLLPKRDENPSGSFLEIETITINKRTAVPDLALALAEFFVTPGHQRQIALSDYGLIPLDQRVRFDRRLSPSTSMMVRQSREAVIIPLAHVETEDILRQVGTDLYIRVLEGVVEPEEGAQELVERVANTEEVDLSHILETEFHQIESSTEQTQ